jgi:hypothetical protein
MSSTSGPRSPPGTAIEIGLVETPAARAVIRHHRHRSRERDRGHAVARGGRRVVAERRGVCRSPRESEPDPGLARFPDRRGGRRRHRDRACGAVHLEHHRRARVGPDRDGWRRIEIARVEQPDIHRDACHAVRVHSAEIGPHQDVGDGHGVRVRHARRDEHVACEPAKRVGSGERGRPIGRRAVRHAGKYLASQWRTRVTTSGFFSENMK